MKNLKKVLTMILTVVMMSFLVIRASAEFPDQNKIENTDAVNMCVALSVIKGREDGKFDPKGTATRAEMAKVICIILNGGKEPILGIKTVPSFKDIKGHWAERYIEYCTSLGIVSGMGDGTFNPNGKVTGTQAAKMLLVALGYDAAYEGFNGLNWSFMINIAANQKGLYDELSIDPNAPLNRDDAAQIMWNSLNAKMVKYTYGLSSLNGKLNGLKFAGEYSDNRTPLSYYYNEADYDGQLTKFTYNSTKKEWAYTVEHSSANPAYMNFTSKSDYTRLYGQNVNVVYKLVDTKIESVYGMYADDSKVLFTGVLNDLEVKSSSIKFNGISYSLDNGASSATKVHAFMYNTGFDLENGTALNALSPTQLTYSFKAIDYDNDGKADFLIAYPYTVKKVNYVGTQRVTAGYSSYYFDDCKIYNGIAINDYTKITEAVNTPTNTTRLDTVDKMIDGKVTKTSGSSYYFDDNAYFLANGVTMSVGDLVKNAAVVNNYIFDAKVYKLTTEDFVVVINTVPSSLNGLNGHQAKLLFNDGTTKIVNTDEDYSGLKGQMVSYDTNKDGEYELQTADYSTASGTFFDRAILPGGDKITSSSNSDRAKYIDNCNIADDAVVFVKQGDGSAERPFVYIVITGSKLLTANMAGITLNGAFATSNGNGFYTVKLAYISSTEPLTSADAQYGYALSDYALVSNNDNKTVCEYTLWNGSKEIKVQAKAGLNTVVNKGDVVKYTCNLDGEIDSISTYSTGSDSAPEVVAITAYDGTRIQLNGTGQSYEIDKNKTVIIYVDNESAKGLVAGSIKLADRDVSGNYIPNAVVMCTGSIVDLIVVDVNNQIPRSST